MKTIWEDDGTSGPSEIRAPPTNRWRVKYWDGSKSELTFDNIPMAIRESRKGLRDWMNDDDGIAQNSTEDNVTRRSGGTEWHPSAAAG